jgi:hypothetical protein
MKSSPNIQRCGSFESQKSGRSTKLCAGSAMNTGSGDAEVSMILFVQPFGCYTAIMVLREAFANAVI